MRVSVCLLLIGLMPFTLHAAAENVLSYGSAVEEASGRFVQLRTLSGFPVPLESSGTYEYSSKSGVLWHTLMPLESRLLISSTTTDQSNQVLSDILLAVFKGDSEELLRYFEASVEEFENSWQIKLKPTGEGLRAAIVEIELSGSVFIETIHIKEQGGSSSRIQLLTETLNTKR